MPSKTTLNAKNLEALGASRLAALLLEVTAGDAAAKQHLRLALAAEAGSGELAQAVGKRLATIGRATGFVDYKKKKTLIKELQAQLDAIVTQVAPGDARRGLDLIWRFLGIARSVFDRCDDSSGEVGEVFLAAREAIGPIATRAAGDPEALADRLYDALRANTLGQYDGLIHQLAPALGAAGLARLKTRMTALGEAPVEPPPKSEEEVVGYGMRGASFRHEMAERHRRSVVQMALKDIADAEGDVDAFIAQYDAKARQMPKIAAEIAQRLIADGRPGQALAYLDDAGRPPHQPVFIGWQDFAWHDARIATLDALNRADEAQAERWRCFELVMSTPHLRAYLKRLDDDLDGEEAALDHALVHPRILESLMFLGEWPDLDRAARLVIERADELDGNVYEILAPAAERLASRSPLAATLLLRAMIDFTLNESRKARYKHAARHLHTCAALASSITDYGRFATHADYDAEIRKRHRRKPSFYPLIA